MEIQVRRSDRRRKAEIPPAPALSFTQAFSVFYTTLRIADAVWHQLETGFGLLSIAVPERM